MSKEYKHSYAGDPYQGGLPEFERSFESTKEEYEKASELLVARHVADEPPGDARLIAGILHEGVLPEVMQYGALQDRTVEVTIVPSELAPEPIGYTSELAVLASPEHADLLGAFRDLAYGRSNPQRKLLSVADGRSYMWQRLGEERRRREAGEEPVTQPEFLMRGGIEATHGEEMFYRACMTSTVAHFEAPDVVPNRTAEAYQEALQDGHRPLNAEQLSGIASGVVDRFLQAEGFRRPATGRSPDEF